MKPTACGTVFISLSSVSSLFTTSQAWEGGGSAPSLAVMNEEESWRARTLAAKPFMHYIGSDYTSHLTVIILALSKLIPHSCLLAAFNKETERDPPKELQPPPLNFRADIHMRPACCRSQQLTTLLPPTGVYSKPDSSSIRMAFQRRPFEAVPLSEPWPVSCLA